jgi:hypothetical protein
VNTDHQLRLDIPWWTHPAWPLLLLTGSVAFVSCWLTNEAYWDSWQVRKFIDSNLAQVLVGLFTVLVLAAIVAALPSRTTEVRQLTFTDRQVVYLRKCYRAAFVATLTGYVLWIMIAAINGVSIEDLGGVLERSSGALTRVKRLAAPVAGLTTLTQFGVVTVALGTILHRLGVQGRAYWWLFALAAVRTVFYAERLALIEVITPVLVIGAVTATRPPGAARWAVRAAPMLAGPAVWLLFAASEYGRSWIHWRNYAHTGFIEWVTLRFAGYYATSFNNSALLAKRFPTGAVEPYFSVQFFWNAPGVDGAIQPGLINGLPPGQWWRYTREAIGNPEYTNPGSFLTTFGELGSTGAVIYWLLFGILFGRLYAGLRKGTATALLTYSCLFVTLLELPRFIYPAEGRATPVIASLIAITLFYPKPRLEPVALLRASRANLSAAGSIR